MFSDNIKSFRTMSPKQKMRSTKKYGFICYDDILYIYMLYCCLFHNHYSDLKFADLPFILHRSPYQNVHDLDPIRTERRGRLMEKFGVNGECGPVPLTFDQSSETWRQKIARGFLYYLEECKNLAKTSASAQQARNFFLRTHGRVSLIMPINQSIGVQSGCATYFCCIICFIGLCHFS